MADANDIALLREFVGQNSEGAFAELVRRRINLVYSVALRFTGNSGDAEDVTQAVFIILARKAGKLSGRVVLTGWLYETTRFTSMRLLRTQARQRTYEQEASVQTILDQSNDDSIWQQLKPHLEAAMSRLGATDRTLLALRYYENRTGAEAAAVLGIREETARKRTNRALEKLRRFFAGRGVASTTAIIAAAISANSVHAAPSGLTQTISAAAVAKGAVASASTLTLAKGALKLMAWTNAKTAIAVGAGILLVAGAASTVTVKGISHHREDAAWARVARAVQTRNFQFPQNMPALVSIRSSKFYPAMESTSLDGAGGKTVGAAVPAAGVVGHAFGIIRDRIVNQDLLPAGRYDYMAITTNHPYRALQAAAEEMFGVTATRETVETNVLVLTVSNPDALHLKQSAPSGSWHDPIWTLGYAKYVNMPMSFFAYTIERRLNVPIIDETGLTNRYDMVIRWSQPNADPDPQTLQEALLNQLGLKLTPAIRPVEVLVLERVK